LVVRDGGVKAAGEARFEAVADYYENRKRAEAAQPGSYRALPAKTLYMPPKEWEDALAAATAHVTTPFHEPESATVVDFDV
ncbi:hypothetical protein, partial [Escherichia coli]